MRLLLSVLVACLAVLSCGPAAAEDDCLGAGFLERFDDRLADPEACEEIAVFDINWEGRSAKLSIIRRLSETHDDDSHWVSQFGQLAEQAGPQLGSFGGLQMDRVTVLLTNLTSESRQAPRGGAGGRSPGTAHASTDFAEGGVCRIVFYKRNAEITAEEFLFTYAHEMFHCAQTATWPEKYANDASLWWLESTAEYFAQRVVRGTESSDGYYRRFDARSVNQSLFDLSYENVVFMLWLGQERGPEGVKALMDAMPNGGDFAGALRALVPLDAWTRFGEMYVDGDIRQPGGRPVPRPGATSGSTLIAAAGSEVFDAPTFVLRRYSVVFAEGRTYRLTAEHADDVSMRMKEGELPWAPPPERVMACDETKGYMLLALSVSDEGGAAVLVVDEPEELDQRACCLIGDWTPTAESRKAKAQQIMEMAAGPLSAQGVGFSCSHSGGDWTLSFRPDGSGDVDWKNFAVECNVEDGGGAYRQTVIQSALVPFNWRIVERGAGMASYGEVEGAVTYRVEAGGGGFERASPFAGPSTSSNGFSYQCSPTDLTIQGVYSLSHREAAHTRASAMPAPDRDE